MKTLNVFVVIMLLFTCGTLRAQVGVGSIEMVKMKAGDISPEDLEALKKTKTVFVFAKKDAAEQENWKKVFQQVWTITPIEFINYDKYSLYQQKANYSFLSIAGFGTAYDGGAVQNIHVYLSLWMNKKNEKGKMEKNTFGRVELFPKPETYNILMIKKTSNESISYLYKDGNFYNWYPGLLKGSIKTLNDVLDKGETKWLFGNSTNTSEVSKLASSTLYIPDYSLIAFNKMTGMESKKLEAEKLMEHYKGQYKIIPAKELSDKIVESESFYYLTFVKSVIDKYVGVYDGQTSELLYVRYRPTSFSMSDDDFKDIQESIDGKEK